jgi:D-amino-acid dehydrogenase
MKKVFCHVVNIKLFSCKLPQNRAHCLKLRHLIDPSIPDAAKAVILEFSIKQAGAASRKPKGQACDVIVLGAGIIGVSTALHLQARGRSVTLVDRGEPGGETSHGNAGLVERSSVIPYAMPRGLVRLARYASNRTTALRYAPAHLPRMLPWLARYWWHSGEARLARIAAEMLPLIEASVSEHMELIGPAGASSLIRNDGWIEVYPRQKDWNQAIADAVGLSAHGLHHEVLDARALNEREPALTNLAGAIHWRDPLTSSDPGALTASYARLFVERGGILAKADALSLANTEAGWSVEDGACHWVAPEVVAALGPWSSDLCERLGYSFPLAFKRGYHMHYESSRGAELIHPVCDPEAGFVLAPMSRGIRLTTGIELADRDAPSDLRQLGRAEAVARQFFPLGRALDPEPWRGSRPCLPDMKPVIGPAARHRGLWFAFGHAHHGFTLGPATGRLLAEMMTGEALFTDPTPYRPDRFRSIS